MAVLAASLLFLLPDQLGEARVHADLERRAKIDWGTILLFGTGIIFGALLADTGLAETIGKCSADALGVDQAVRSRSSPSSWRS